ncbi:peritrophin-1-like [Vespa crabro]|uniref:peritrophin-1-like n=1 Tax=Vespa crabro TaxID=7445 RepID=UPI001F011497|nr:peritrophin-1-like [Vespa crabro]
MKGEIAIIVAFAAVTVTAYYPGDTPILPVPTTCPDEDPVDRTVHLAHVNCEKFYKCLAGEKIEMLCPLMDRTRRLHFNKVLQVCDYPSRAGCAGSVTPSTQTPPTQFPPTQTPPIPTPTSCLNAPNNALIPHEKRCHLYYRCDGKGQGHLERCDIGESFNPIEHVCDKSGVCLLTDICKDFRDVNELYVADPVSCQSVYVCNELDTVKLYCGNGSEWSKEEKKCLPANQANCKV